MSLFKALMDITHANTIGKRMPSTVQRPQLDLKPTGVAPDQPGDIRMIPWVLPVSVAVVMVIVLMCSFCHHHRRFLQQRRHASRHYLYEYRRVAGPIFSLAATMEDTSDGPATCGSGEQDDRPTSILTASALTKRLRRCYSWSPRIFKTKHMLGLRSGIGTAAMKKNAKHDSQNSLGSNAHALSPTSPMPLVDLKFPAKVLEEIQDLQRKKGLSEEKLNVQLSALARWASASQFIRRKRSLVVTTSSGALVTDHGQSEPDVTSLYLGQQNNGAVTGVNSKSVDKMGLDFAQNNHGVSDEKHMMQANIPDYLASSGINNSLQCFYRRNTKESVLCSSIPETDSSARTDGLLRHINGMMYQGKDPMNDADLLRTIQITPTTYEASRDIDSAFNTSPSWAVTGQQMTQGDLSSRHDVNNEWKWPSPPRLLLKPMESSPQSSCQFQLLQSAVATGEVHMSTHFPEYGVQTNYSPKTKDTAFKDLKDIAKDGKTYMCDPMRDHTISNISPQELSRPSPMVKVPTAILNSMYEMYHVLMMLHDFPVLEPDQRMAGKETIGLSEERRHPRLGMDVLQSAVLTLKSHDLQNKLIKREILNQHDHKTIADFNVPLDDACCGTPLGQDSKDPGQQVKPEPNQLLCPHCVATKKILGRVEKSKLQSVEQFLAKAMAKLLDHSSNTCDIDPCMSATISTTRPPRPCDQELLLTPANYSYNSRETPLLLGRRRAATETSTMTVHQSLLPDRDSTIPNSTSCEASSQGPKQCKDLNNINHRAITDEFDKQDAVSSISGNSPILRHRNERKQSREEERELVGCQSLPDSPNSWDTIIAYMDSSLTSLHETVV